MPTFDNDLLIDWTTGEIDFAEVERTARARAQSAYGVDCTDHDVAYWTDKVMAMASMLRVKRRRELGLPDDDVSPRNGFDAERRAITYGRALRDPAMARLLFNASKGGDVRGITEDHRFELANVLCKLGGRVMLAVESPTASPKPISRDAAALQLAGYVTGILSLETDTMPEWARVGLAERVARVHESQGILNHVRAAEAASRMIAAAGK